MSPTAGWSLALLIIIATLIIPSNSEAQATAGPDQLRNFDLMLLSSPTRRVRNQSLVLVNTSSPRPMTVPLPPLDAGYYDHVTSDPGSSLLYWASSKGRLGYFNLHSSQHGMLYSNDQSISELSYAANTLHWIEKSRAIKSLATGETEPKTLVEASDGDKIQGLAVDTKTGTLFYTIWPRSSRTNASIYSIAPTSTTGSLLASGLDLPTFLTFQSPYLYWVSNPPGLDWELWSMNTNAHEPKQVVAKQSHQHASSLAVSCSGVYWTELDNKQVWQRGAQVADGKQVDGQLLGDFSTVPFRQVSALQTDCPQKMAKMVQLNREITTQTSSTEQHDAATTSSAELPVSSSSESVEAQAATTTSPPGIRLCSELEFTRTCGTAMDVICVVMVDGRPVCLSKQPLRQVSTPERYEQTTAKTEAPESPEPTPVSQEQNSTMLVHPPQQSSSWPPEAIIIISVLSTLATVMSLISLYMTIRVRNLSKKPVIRRRVVVSTRTSESGSSTPASVCEMIDIENCCNMNVCETPCYERTLLNPQSPNTSSTCTTTTQNGSTHISVNSSNSNWTCGGNKATKEDKKCLLSSR